MVPPFPTSQQSVLSCTRNPFRCDLGGQLKMLFCVFDGIDIMVIAIDENIPLLPEALAPCGTVRTFAANALTHSDMRDVDALFVRSKTRVDSLLLQGTPVRFVGTATAGTDHIDSAYLSGRGTSQASAAGCNAMSVAEYVIYAALYWSVVRQETLRGKTLGIIGFGNVGKRVARIAHGLSMRVLLNDPPLAQQGYCFPDDCPHVDSDTLMAKADIVTVHVPLVRTGAFPTVQLLSPARLHHMRSGALLVQASRGGVVSEQAVLPLLAAGRLHAAFDVWENEPAVYADLAHQCLLATPHIAGYSWEGKVRGSEMMARAFAQWSGVQPLMEVFSDAVNQQNDTQIGTLWSNEAVLFHCLQQSRCLHDDDRAFREILSLPAGIVAQRFHALRKNYPKRREVVPEK